MATDLQFATRPDYPAESSLWPTAVLCGSFRRDRHGLVAAYEALSQAECRVLSPLSLDFVDEVDGFVLAGGDQDEPIAAIEERHLRAIRGSDFVWLHCPDGYVGASAALEIGVAHSLDVPVFAAEAPSDVTISQFVSVVDGPAVPAAAARRTVRTPAGPLRDLQDYYGRMADARGFTRESPQDTMLLLTEEVGELARAIRKTVGIARAGEGEADPASELADVQLYLLHLANIVGIDLAAAVHSKERLNHQRYPRIVA